MPGADTSAFRRSVRAPLWAALLLSFLGYGLLALWFPLLPNAGRVPPGDVRAFSPTLAAGLIYAAVVLALFLLFVAACRRVADGDLTSGKDERRALAALLLVAALLAATLLFAYPITATDVYR